MDYNLNKAADLAAWLPASAGRSFAGFPYFQDESQALLW
jgi:hypothetical protein